MCFFVSILYEKLGFMNISFCHFLLYEQRKIWLFSKTSEEQWIKICHLSYSRGWINMINVIFSYHNHHKYDIPMTNHVLCFRATQDDFSRKKRPQNEKYDFSFSRGYMLWDMAFQDFHCCFKEVPRDERGIYLRGSASREYELSYIRWNMRKFMFWMISSIKVS